MDIISMTPGSLIPDADLGGPNVVVGLFWLIICLSIAVLAALTVLIFVIEPNTSSSSSSSTSSASSASSASSTSSFTLPPSGCCSLLSNLQTDCAFWLQAATTNPLCIPAFRLTNATQMYQTTLTADNLATQDVFGPDFVVRTGGVIQANPGLPAPVITTPPTEWMRIANDGTTLFKSNTVGVPNATGAAFYFGVPNTVGSWRIQIDTVNNLFLIQAFVGSSYLTKFTVSV